MKGWKIQNCISNHCWRTWWRIYRESNFYAPKGYAILLKCRACLCIVFNILKTWTSLLEWSLSKYKPCVRSVKNYQSLCTVLIDSGKIWHPSFWRDYILSEHPNCWEFLFWIVGLLLSPRYVAALDGIWRIPAGDQLPVRVQKLSCDAPAGSEKYVEYHCFPWI